MTIPGQQLLDINLKLFGEDDLEDDNLEQDESTEDTTEVEETETQEDYLELGDDLPVFNKEPRKVKKAEAKDLLQKGMNYDKVHGRAQSLETQLQRAAKVQGFETVEEYLTAVETAEREAEASDYATTHGITNEEAQRELDRERRVQALENEIKTTKRLSSLEKEKEPFKDKLYFKELEPEIDQIIKENAERGTDISVEAAYFYLRGQRLEELMSKKTATAVKSTIANIHDRAKRGVVTPDGSVGDDVDTTDVDTAMAKAFGNDPKKIAKYVKQQTKRS